MRSTAEPPPGSKVAAIFYLARRPFSGPQVAIHIERTGARHLALRADLTSLLPKHCLQVLMPFSVGNPIRPRRPKRLFGYRRSMRANSQEVTHNPTKFSCD